MKKPCIIITLPFLLVGCATYQTTLTDSQGRKITCEASGRSGIVTGYYLRRGFEQCVDNAKANGFTAESPAPKPFAP